MSSSNFHIYRHTQKPDHPFSFAELYQHPNSLKAKDPGGDRLQVGIIGGGIAGLTAAYELSQLSYEVTILEASHRLGGRIYTHYFSDGSYGELGAMRIPINHSCVLHYVEKFNLSKGSFVNYNPNAFYYLRGQKARLNQFQKLFSVYHLDPAESIDPRVLYENILKELLDCLSDREKWEIFSPTFTSGKLKEYNRLTFSQYFRDRLSPDAFELVGRATGMIYYDEISVWSGLIDFFAWYQAEQYQLVGGMETLVKAFVERLPGKIERNAKVNLLQMTDQGVRVGWDNLGSKKEQEFDYVICTVPATALARIEFYPPLPANKIQAICGLGYSNAAKTIFHCTARPWELYDHIYGGGSFTDLPMEKCWYPSDNAILADSQTEKLCWVAQDPEISHQPTAFTAAYRWDSNVRHFLSLEEGKRTDLTLAEVKQLHSQIDRYVDDVIHCIWDEKTQVGSGAYAFFAPGEQERYQSLLCQSYPLEKPRVFFAGEHLAINHASIQGAMYTAVAAVIELLEGLVR